MDEGKGVKIRLVRVKKKKPAGKTRAKKATRKISVKKQTIRDILFRPSVAQIEESIRRGSTQSASAFRTSAGW